MEINDLKKEDEKSWDEYVLNHPDSTFFHQIGWKNVIEKSYGHESHYILATEDNTIKGVLPLFFMKSFFFGKKLVSLPFAPYGGALGEKKAVELLTNHAINLTKELGANYLEIRKANNSSFSNSLNLLTNYLYAASILELDQNPEVVWNEKLTRNKRKNVVKSQKRDLSVNFSNEIDEFYRILAINMHDLGSPVHSKKFFNSIFQEFPKSAKIQAVRFNGRTVYAAFYLFYKSTIINSWSSSIEDYRKYYPTDFGIWTAIEYGCHNNYRYYDFGRSQLGSENMEFKERWGAETKKLQYQYFLNKRGNIPDNTSANPNRQNFMRLWKRLPISVTYSFGHMLRKMIG